jgi:hypothetical protein
MLKGVTLVDDGNRGTPLTALTHVPSSFVAPLKPFTVMPVPDRSVPACSSTCVRNRALHTRMCYPAAFMM